MIETTFEIAFSESGTAGVVLETNAGGELELQAGLVGFAHYAVSVISFLGTERAEPLIRSLAQRGPADDGQPLGESAGGVHRVLARFVDARRGPRLFFRLSPRDLRRLGDNVDVLAERSVFAILKALAEKGEAGAGDCGRVTATAALIAGAAGAGYIQPHLAFDVSLAAADVAWRAADAEAPPVPRGPIADLRCPACGSRELEFRLWPSDQSALRRCPRCGAGSWFRAGSRPRLLSNDAWQGLERMRDGLQALAKSPPPGHVSSGHESARVFLDDLKTLFRKNGWPFSDVRGAPVLLSELSGALGSWKFYAHAVEEQDLILLYSVCPLRVPEKRRLEVSEFLTRANYGLAAGNFELDFTDGEVRYKTALQRPVDGLDAATLKRVVRANGIAMETYIPGIGAVITGTAPLRALERRATVRR